MIPLITCFVWLQSMCGLCVCGHECLELHSVVMQTSKMANRIDVEIWKVFARISWFRKWRLCHNNNYLSLTYNTIHQLMKLFISQFLQIHSKISREHTVQMNISLEYNFVVIRLKWKHYLRYMLHINNNEYRVRTDTKEKLGSILSLKIQLKIFIMKF